MPQIGERKTSPDGSQQAEFDGKGWTLVSSPVHAQKADSAAAQEHGAPASGSPIEMYHASGSDTPFSAGAKEMGRTALEAGKGILQSPLDMLHGLIGLPAAATNAVGELVKDPSLLMEGPRAIKDTAGMITDPNTNPRDMGSLLGQTLIGAKMPAMMKGAADAIPSVRGLTGRGISAVGSGMEAVGTHPVTNAIKPVEWSGVPKILEHGGRGMQALGDRLTNGPKPNVDPYMPNRGRVSTEVPYRSGEPTGVDGLNSASGSPQMPQSLSSLIEQGRTSPNTSGYQPGAGYGHSAAGVEGSGLEPHMANASSGRIAYADDAVPSQGSVTGNETANSSGYRPGYAEGAEPLPASVQSLIDHNSTPPSDFPAGQGANGTPLGAEELAGEGSQRFMHGEFDANNPAFRARQNQPLITPEQTAGLKAGMPDSVRALAEKVGLASDSRFPADGAHDLGTVDDYGSSTRATMGDLMDQYQQSTAGPAAPFEMDGQTYAADANGSHVAVPDSLASLTGKPTVRMSSGGYPAEWDAEIPGEGDMEPTGAGRRRSEKAYKARGYATREP